MLPSYIATKLSGYWAATLAWEPLGREPAAVSITYYRDQATYDRFGREAGPFGQANATANAIACELERTGIKVKFRYPDDSAIPTPRSNY